MEIRPSLTRLLHPATVAVVGANESLGMSNNAVLPMLEAGRAVHLVNPKRDTLYGRPVHSSLTDIGSPVDAVLALVNAERAVELVEEAAAMGCGGVVVTAAGFGEVGEEGAALQQRLVDAALVGGVAVVGPNCAGFKNVALGANLFTGGRLDLEPGGVAVVSQSGFLARAALAAAHDRRLGVSVGVSSGNEAVCDLSDYVAVLAEDEATRVICLVIEVIRKPAAFFDAVAAARRAGKAVVALKLGRGDRSRRIMTSHTGAIADESWVYDLAFSEHGVVSVRDIDHLLDAAQLFAQLPPTHQAPIRSIGIITTSGGVAALAADLAEDADAPVPPLDEIAAWVRERVPGDTVNPLDLTGFVMTQRDLTEELFAKYADAVDLLVLAWWIGQDDQGWSSMLLDPFSAVARTHTTPFLVSPVEATSIGAWVAPLREDGLLFGRGIDSVYRAVAARNTHLAAAPRTLATVDLADTGPPGLVTSEVGPIATFADAMKLLADAGIAVAPYVVVDPDTPSDEPDFSALGDAVVVKLADVAHRTELGAVAVGVRTGDIAAEIERLRAIAATEGVPDTVVVQAMVTGVGEAFAGLQCRTGLGPVLLFGRGGVLVETGGGVRGRLLPLDDAAGAALVDAVAGPEVFAALRGQTPWPTEALAYTLAALDRLWRTNGAWLESVDINPLIVTHEGVVAVDALLVAQEAHP